MATLTMPASATRNAPVEILPRQPTVTISSAPSLGSYHHYQLPTDYTGFPDTDFDFEELVEVDELLTELGMSVPTNGYAEGDDDVVPEASYDDHYYQEGSLPPFSSSAVPPPQEEQEEVPETSAITSTNGVVRTVSMEQVAFATTISDSVPNPMRNYQMDDEPPAKKPKIYAPLLPHPPTTTTSATITPTATIPRPVTTTSISKNITKPKATIAKSSSIPTLLPSTYLPSTPTTATRSVVPASSERKRKLSRKEAELNMSAEELEERRERNRSHAKKSRQRKKAMTELLQESVQSLQHANQMLREGLNAQLGPQYAEDYLQAREEAQRDSFLQALMNPENRVMDAGAVAFLKKLQKRIPKDSAAMMDANLDDDDDDDDDSY